MIGNIVAMPDGTFSVFEEAPSYTFEAISANVGMCIMVMDHCVGKTTGVYEDDLALKTLAEDTYPTDDLMYSWDEDTTSWVEVTE